MLTVGYQFIGLELPTKSATLPVTDGWSLKNYTMVRGEVWEFPFDDSKGKAIRYYKTTSKDDTAIFEVWFSEKEHVPLRSVIGLNAQYGATIQVKKSLRCKWFDLTTMLRSTLIANISITLLGFILFKGRVSLLCDPQQLNSVASMMSNAMLVQEPAKIANSSDPLSWEPILYRLMNLLSKTCPR